MKNVDSMNSCVREEVLCHSTHPVAPGMKVFSKVISEQQKKKDKYSEDFPLFMLKKTAHMGTQSIFGAAVWGLMEKKEHTKKFSQYYKLINLSLLFKTLFLGTFVSLFDLKNNVLA